MSFIEIDYNDFKSRGNVQSEEEALIEKAVKTTLQILYDRGYLINVTMQTEFQKFTYLQRSKK